MNQKPSVTSDYCMTNLASTAHEIRILSDANREVGESEPNRLRNLTTSRKFEAAQKPRIVFSCDNFISTVVRRPRTNVVRDGPFLCLKLSLAKQTSGELRGRRIRPVKIFLTASIGNGALTTVTATAEEVNLNAPHAPHDNAITAFKHVMPKIKDEIKKSLELWKDTPKMWSRAEGLIENHQLFHFSEKDLVQVRSGVVSYGTIIFGKIRIPAVNDELGEGYIHVRIFDPPNSGPEDVKFHSLFTYEGDRDEDGQAHFFRAIQTKDEPLEFFQE
ncbi:hypothetical protein F5I97DRAFT_2072292 [Phlebopus sp. FC_14]|nr:hypothetical protein F5I97DRAFT_2072292 [Phlebopus sp. FC_14]